jgi:hypothetical protein
MLNKDNHMGYSASIDEMLMTWEGPAIPAPGVMFGEWYAQHPEVEPEASEVAAWLAVTALSRSIQNSTTDAIKKRVLEVLAALRQRYGQVKIDKIKQQLLLRMQAYVRKPKVPYAEMCERIELLFQEIPV